MNAPAIETPCRKVCVVDGKTSMCLGCGRKLPEIAGWLQFSADQRRAIMAELPARLAAMAKPVA